MNYEFEEDQSEEYYRKILLLDKVKPFLYYEEKEYIFNKKICWDILFKDEDAPEFSLFYSRHIFRGRCKELEPIMAKNGKISFYYAENILYGRFELGEPAIANKGGFSYLYAKNVIKGRFLLGEEKILNSPWKHDYLNFLQQIGKRHELDII